MNPTIQNLTTAQLYTARFLIWDAIEEQWSAPQTLAAAREAHARDPELQAAAILPDGTTTAPAPLVEIIQRTKPAAAPADLTLISARAQAANTRAATHPAPAPAQGTAPENAIQAQPRNTPNALPRETINRINHALGLFIILTYASLYISAASAIIIGLTTETHIISIAGIIVGVGVFVLQSYLTQYEN